MPIVPLSSATARLIGSAASITSPSAVVKELLDNAIDAGADAVEVAVSSDTLERLRVRDNGQGIAPSDIDHLGQPAHTSKLAAFDELAAGRVRTLGFRGQALASIVGISASVHVVTRTAGEPVACRVRLGGGGGGRQGTVSAPVGTTVEVEGLFANLPPRRRMLLKEGRKTTARIRELLVAYALANPALRVNFRVLGNERQACTLGQTRGRDMKRSVLEVFGAAVAAAGQTHRFASAAAASSCTLLAFLPSVGGDHKVLAGKGAFISVNGRPLCSTTGIGKALAGVLKTNMQQLQLRTRTTVQKPLFLLEILCPFTDYDANVATLKDDVLFADADALLRTFGEMCEQVYGKTSAAQGSSGQGTMGRENVGGASTEELPMSSSTEEKLVSTQMRTAYRVNMHRTNSNATDEGAGFQTVEVTVPERRHVEIEMQPSGKANYFKGGMSKPMRGIERYFQRTAAAAVDDFEIATDDTATPERPRVEDRHEEEADPLVNRTTFQERMPLSDVPDATLNILAGFHGSMPSDGSNHGDGPRLSDLHGTSWSIQNLINQQRDLGVPLTATRGGGGGSSSSSSSSSLAGPPGSQMRGAPLLERARVPLLRTPPPSSDPTTIREEPRRSFVPASRVVAQPSPASSRSSPEGSARVKETQGRPAQWPVTTRHAAVLPGTISSAPYRAERGSSAMGAPRPQGRPLPRTRQQAATVERAVPTRQLVYEQVEEEADDAEDATTARQGEGTCQALMGRRVGRAGGALQESLAAESDTSVAESADTPPQAKRRRGASQEADRSAIVRHAATPPRRMQWSVNQQSDNPLPLESVPAGMGTWRCVATAEASFSDVRMWMDLEREMDAYIRSGTLALGRLGSCLTGQDAMWLEARVKQLCQV
ncbi:DNA mismatch repair protein [Cordyceps fumosorosea ARSEF 2679]|uniref:DNA mismatch repair protein n=1 Tax=Cordyceps fumosorosea (strain ARSEF 2679) TaxID=1081104 RepID=A0A167XF60_CORFA|nr:DNA mismatch repair protein [Cordyceps fumosorosea ARSEF 2679]OAA64905.1 DNA mismatch repair protein [Cordyceps fumosorosea ARSEF 2679]